jgi:ABC-type lipoprotein export system ATPase subunit
MTRAAGHPTTLVDARDLSKTYITPHAEVTAIASATFAIENGARIAVVGPSGSGKSTLLQIVAGLDDPSSGTIVWPGLGPRSTLRPGRLAMMFQAPSLLPALDVIENTMLPLALLGETGISRAAGEAALAAFGLEALASKLPQELSGGQAQRVALARAIVTNPGLLIADEPTGQLDRTTAASVMAELSDWAARTGGAILIATHDPEVAGAMATTWRMDHGRLVSKEPSR